MIDRICQTPGCYRHLRSDNKADICGKCKMGVSDAIKAQKAKLRRPCEKCGKLMRLNCTSLLCTSCRREQSAEKPRCSDCGRVIWRTNETGRCEKCQNILDLHDMMPVKTDRFAICRECGDKIPLGDHDNPKWFRWCLRCKPIVTHESRGYEHVGCGEVGW